MTETNHPSWGQIHVPHRVLRAFHIAAAGLAVAVALLLILDLRYGWLRHSPGGEAFDVGLQPWFILLFAVGALVAQRWKVVGGALATFTAAALVIFAARQLRPLDATLVLIGFLVPALLWLVVGLFEYRDERFHRTDDEHPRSLLRRRDVIAGAVVLGVTGFGGVRLGRWLFDRLYGPTHPQSTTSAVQGSTTRWLWSGAITSNGAAVTTRLVNDDAGPVELLVGRGETLSDAVTIAGRNEDEGLVRVDIGDLEPDTDYHYAFVVAGEVDRARIGRFRTFPKGPVSFNLVIAACARTGSNGVVFDTIRTLDPTLVIFDGDLHYADITRNDQQAFRQILDHTLGQPAQAALFQRCPVAYVWDDHDFGGSDGSSRSRPAAMATYRRFVPHYPLEAEDSAINQALTIGRVRILLTDARSNRRPGEDFEPGTMLGPTQKQWLLDELVAARDSHALTIWVNPVPWIAPAGEEGDTDTWGGYASERSEIADFISDNGIAPSLLMLSGDAHMLAFDDGTNSDYSRRGDAGFPVFHAAALDRPGSIKGGPYSHERIPGGGQFGHVEVSDDGESVSVHLIGRNWRNQILMDHRIPIR